MQFIVHGHHLELTESLKERCRSIHEKAEKLLDDPAARMEIELSDEFGEKQRKGDKVCRVRLRIPGQAPVLVTETRSDMYEAIDIASDRVVEALRRALKKRETYSRESIKTLTPPGDLEAVEAIERPLQE